MKIQPQDWYLIKYKEQWLQGKIDPEDADLCRYNWNLDNNGYARCSMLFRNGKTAYLHKIIAERMGIELDLIDHKNGVKLDNRRCNLRGATKSENMMNTRKKVNNTSGYKGVTEMKDHYRLKKWRAQIIIKSKLVYTAYFEKIEEAIRAYDLMALKFHGEFAQLNLPEERELRLKELKDLEECSK